MAESFVITLYKTTDLVSGELKVVQLDTSITALWLRKFDDAGTYTTQYSLTSLGNAKFLAEVPDGRYQLWKSAYPDATAGNRMDFWHGGDAKFKWVSDKDMAYITASANNTFTGTNTFNGNTVFGGDIQLGTGDYIYVTEDAVTDSQLPNLGQVNDLIAAVLVANNTFTGTNTFNGDTVFGGDIQLGTGDYIYVTEDATIDSQLPNLGQVNDLIAASTIIPYQESPNVIRLIPGGSERTGQVYTTYANAMQYALATAGTDHRMCIKIEGMGVAGYNYINMSNAGGAYIDDYIHLKGINQDILLIPPATVTVGVSALDNTIIENLTIYKDDIGIDLVFENLFFKDVAFNLAVNSLTFTNCKFKNCDLKINSDGGTDATFTTCKGNFIASNQAVGVGVDANIKPKADF